MTAEVTKRVTKEVTFAVTLEAVLDVTGPSRLPGTRPDPLVSRGARGSW